MRARGAWSEERMENSEERRAKSEGRSRFPHPSSLIPHPSSCSRGFTLLELLAVFIIIAVLAGAILGVTKYAATNAATSRARAEIAAMETALESFRKDNGIYPPSNATRNSLTPPGFPTSIEINNSGSLYAALAGVSPWTKQYFSFKPSQLKNSGTFTYIVDPFGSPYNYYQPGATNQVTFDLWSYGPDGQNGTADDIVNWRR